MWGTTEEGLQMQKKKLELGELWSVSQESVHVDTYSSHPFIARICQSAYLSMPP